MTTNSPSTAVGVFDNQEQVEQAIAELRAVGFTDSQLAVGPHAAERGDSANQALDWETGAAIGGLSGAALGGLAAGPPGMLGVGLVGLLLGALIDLEISEEEAHWYSKAAAAGRIILTVRTKGRYADAHRILLRHGGEEMPTSSSDL